MFDILDKNVNVHHHYILEASAGTGKTFSIENIVVRLLIEDAPVNLKPLEIQDILVVTFTRAATHDLRLRIRENILKTISLLQLPSLPSTAPDYLFNFSDPQLAKKAKKNLEKALFNFDQAHIYTIHSFCTKILRTHFFEGDLGLHVFSEDEMFTQADLRAIMRNFFRTELNPQVYGKMHFQLLLKTYDHSLEKLEADLAKLILKGVDIVPTPTFQELFSNFQSEMMNLKNLGFSSKHILHDFHALVPLYTGITNRQKVVKSDILDKAEHFASLFDQQEWSLENFEEMILDQLSILKLFDPSRRSKKTVEPNLVIPDLLTLLKKHLDPLVNPLTLYARLACDCQKFVQKYQREEEKFRYDDLLHATLKALTEERFTTHVRQTFKAALIDEFQDTDPTQWQIFSQLFMHKDYQGCLYLVGDPKQSIYSFRQADIYTYLAASTAIGEENKVSLGTNYRSHPDLVKALNTLFSSVHNFTHLPKQKANIPFLPVNPSEKKFKKGFSDSLGAVHFIISLEEKSSENILEDDTYLPFVVNEIQRLHTEDHFAFRDFAILVSDRYQSQKVAQFLKTYQIPSFTQRPVNLADSIALPALIELLEGVLNPRHMSSLKVALGGQIIGWDLEKLIQLQNQTFYEMTLDQLFNLRKVLLEEGFASFYQMLIHESLFGIEQTIGERLLREENGESFFEELGQIAEILISHQYETQAHPEGLVAFLRDFDQMQLNENDLLNKRLNAGQDAVQILTQHSSKGLEFEIVFVLGLIKRASKLDSLIPESDPPRLSLISNKEDPRYLNFCEEIDAEKMRQLYVALTRAKYRVYVAATSPFEKIHEGFATPMELFLAKINTPSSTYKELYEHIRTFNYEEFCKFLDTIGSRNSISYSCESVHLPASTIPIQDQSDSFLLPPTKVEIPDSTIGLYSFTYLAKQSEQYFPVFTPPHDFENPIKNAHTLPAGNATGILLHEILEKIPFEILKEISNLEDFSVTQYLEGTDFLPWERTIAEMLFKTFKTPITFEDQIFCLQDISTTKVFRELEFLYPCESGIFNLNQPKGYLKGVIDLIFEMNGKYYLIDWKTNWLGPDQNAYCHSSLENAMISHQYHLQSAIYVESLKRYLNTYNMTNFSEIFGGIYYVFLRGIDPSDNSSGIYQVKGDIGC